ncbi:hypothetical protein AB0425_40910 [Actinosynnema sp. NPDC051121]
MPGAERRLGRGVDRTKPAERVTVSPAGLYAYLNGTTLPRGAVFGPLLDELGVNGPERGRLTTVRDAAGVAHRVRADPAAPVAGGHLALRQPRRRAGRDRLGAPGVARRNCSASTWAPQRPPSWWR